MADLLILLDSSHDEDLDHFQKQLDFIKAFVSQFKIGPNDVQVGLSTYSDTLHEQFKLNTYHDKQDMLDAISLVPYSGSFNVLTDQALQYAQNIGFRPDHGGRTNASHIVILVAMGPSTNQSATLVEAEQLQNDPNIDLVGSD